MSNATMFYASILTFLYLYLAANVIKLRKQYRQPYLASPEHPELMRAVRAQANFSEYTPLFLILLLLEEARFHHEFFCYLVGFIFSLGRAAHAYAFLVHESRAAAEGVSVREMVRFRYYGMICTFSSLAMLAALLFVQFLF